LEGPTYYWNYLAPDPKRSHIAKHFLQKLKSSLLAHSAKKKKEEEEEEAD